MMPAVVPTIPDIIAHLLIGRQESTISENMTSQTIADATVRNVIGTMVSLLMSDMFLIHVERRALPPGENVVVEVKLWS